MGLPYFLLCLAHGSHKVHSRKQNGEWFGHRQRLGEKLLYYQEGLFQVKKICQSLIINVRSTESRLTLLDDFSTPYRNTLIFLKQC